MGAAQKKILASSLQGEKTSKEATADPAVRETRSINLNFPFTWMDFWGFRKIVSCIFFESPVVQAPFLGGKYILSNKINKCSDCGAGQSIMQSI